MCRTTSTVTHPPPTDVPSRPPTSPSTQHSPTSRSTHSLTYSSTHLPTHLPAHPHTPPYPDCLPTHLPTHQSFYLFRSSETRCPSEPEKEYRPFPLEDLYVQTSVYLKHPSSVRSSRRPTKTPRHPGRSSSRVGDRDAGGAGGRPSSSRTR